MPGPRATQIVTENHCAQDSLHGFGGLLILLEGGGSVADLLEKRGLFTLREGSGGVAELPDKLLLEFFAHDHLALRSGAVDGCHYA